MTELTQDENNQQSSNAYEAWADRDPSRHSKTELASLWEDMWSACDFSWDGLKNYVWRAPLNFPSDGEVIGNGRAAYRKSNLQEYWRWSLGQYEDHIENTLVKDQYLINAGLLIKVDGKLWHAIHLKDTNIKANNALEIAILKRLDKASEISEQFPFSAQFTDARCQFTGARAQGITKLWRDYSFANSEPQSDKPQLHISAEWSELSNVNCSFLIFGDHLDLSNAILKNDINFEHAEFVGITRFTDTIFFSRSTFLKASFEGLTEFAYTIFLKSAIFSYATFSAYADFANTNFLHDTYFGNVTFNDSVLFQGVAFLSSVKFEHAIFSGNTYFYAAVFTKTISFVEAKFHKPTYFSDTFWAWDKQEQRWLGNHYGRAFYGAKFLDVANFETNHFNAFAAFDGAIFNNKLYLRLPSETGAPKQRFHEACIAAEAQIRNDTENTNRKENKARPIEEIKRAASTARWGELSSGYQTVKAVMERNGDVDRAQVYHRYEIEARLRRPTTTPAERLTARLYKSCSDYGASIILPIFTLAGLFWLFGAIYLILAMLAGADIAPFRPETAYAADLLDAFSLSFKNAFLQLDGFGQITSEQMQALFGNGLISWIARFVGVIQTFLSLILAFLFGLAVRRKFQIR